MRQRLFRGLICALDCPYVPRVLSSGMLNDNDAFLRLPYLDRLPMPKDPQQFRKICLQIVPVRAAPQIDI